MFLYGNTEILRDYVKEPRIEDYFQRSTLNISNVTLVFIFGTIYCAFDSLHEYIICFVVHSIFFITLIRKLNRYYGGYFTLLLSSHNVIYMLC